MKHEFYHTSTLHVTLGVSKVRLLTLRHSSRSHSLHPSSRVSSTTVHLVTFGLTIFRSSVYIIDTSKASSSGTTIISVCGSHDITLVLQSLLRQGKSTGWNIGWLALPLTVWRVFSTIVAVSSGVDDESSQGRLVSAPECPSHRLCHRITKHAGSPSENTLPRSHERRRQHGRSRKYVSRRSIIPLYPHRDLESLRSQDTTPPLLHLASTSPSNPMFRTRRY